MLNLGSFKPHLNGCQPHLFRYTCKLLHGRPLVPSQKSQYCLSTVSSSMRRTRGSVRLCCLLQWQTQWPVMRWFAQFVRSKLRLQYITSGADPWIYFWGGGGSKTLVIVQHSMMHKTPALPCRFQRVGCRSWNFPSQFNFPLEFYRLCHIIYLSKSIDSIWNIAQPV